MLVGGSVEQIVGFVSLEESLHVSRIADACYDGFCLDVWVLLGHQQSDVVLRGLCLVY